MKIKLHRMLFACPRCDKTATTTFVSFAANGECRIEGLCVKCGIRLFCNTTVVDQVSKAYKADLEEELARANPLQPPLAEKSDDDEFLRKMGIDPGETIQ